MCMIRAKYWKEALLHSSDSYGYINVLSDITLESGREKWAYGLIGL